MVDINALFQDKNFLNLLAGTGARLGKGGVGEAIGVPAQQMIQSQAAQAATAKAEKERKAWLDAFTRAAGGLTPKGQPGINSIKTGNEGQLMIDTTPPAFDEEGTPGVPKATDQIPFL